MSQIEQALSYLYERVDVLENVAEEQEQELLRLRQRELFATEQLEQEKSKKNNVEALNQQALPLDMDAFAGKLDSTINKLEEMLTEG